MIHKKRPLKLEEKECTKCPFHKTAIYTNKIDGWGSNDPDILFVGEAPGKNEDEEGLPFIGSAGSILHETLAKLNYDYDSIRITNSVRCWPGQGNPTPKATHIRACNPYLLDEIRRYDPKVVVMLGAVALKAASGKTGITKLRGTAWENDNRLYLPTFHPAALIYDKDRKQQFEDDLALAKNLVSDGLPTPTKVDWQTLDNYKAVEKLIDFLTPLKQSLVFDLETHPGPDPYEQDARVIMFNICWEIGKARAIPLFKTNGPYDFATAEKVLKLIQEMFAYRTANGLAFDAYNAVFELKWSILKLGVEPWNLEFDPFIAHHLIDEELKMPSLSQLTWLYTELGGYDNELLSLLKSEPAKYDPSRGGSFDNIPYKTLGYYGCGDVDSPLRLKEKFIPIMKETGVWDLFERISLPASFPIMEYEKNGVKVDRKFLDDLAFEYPKRIQKLKSTMRELPEVQQYEEIRNKIEQENFKEKLRQRELDYREKLKRHEQGLLDRKPSKLRDLKQPDIFIYNPASDYHNRDIVFDIIGLEPVKYTDNKAPSLDKDVREVLLDEHELIRFLDDYAKLKKFNSSYIQRYKKKLTDDNNILYPFYSITGTVSGRLVSDFQQLPRDGTNSDIKKLFISRFGDEGLIFNGDVNQAELRCLTIVSKDPGFTKIFSEGKDAHSMAACWINNLEYEEFETKKDSGDKYIKELRSQTKSINFGLIYGLTAMNLAKQIGWTVRETENFINNKYFAIFGQVRDCISWYHDFCIRHGFVKNMLGRIRHLPDAKIDGSVAQSRALRQAFNFIIQSMSHDLTLFAEYQIWKLFQEYDLESKMIGEIHDSIVVDVYKPELETVAIIVKTVLENLKEHFDWISIPMKCDVSAGPNLLEQEDLVLDV